MRCNKVGWGHPGAQLVLAGQQNEQGRERTLRLLPRPTQRPRGGVGMGGLGEGS